MIKSTKSLIQLQCINYHETVTTYNIVGYSRIPWVFATRGLNTDSTLLSNRIQYIYIIILVYDRQYEHNELHRFMTGNGYTTMTLHSSPLITEQVNMAKSIQLIIQKKETCTQTSNISTYGSYTKHYISQLHPYTVNTKNISKRKIPVTYIDQVAHGSSMDKVYHFQLPPLLAFLAPPPIFPPHQALSLCPLCESYTVLVEGHLKLKVRTLPLALHPGYLDLLVDHMQEDG